MKPSYKLIPKYKASDFPRGFICTTHCAHIKSPPNATLNTSPPATSATSTPLKPDLALIYSSLPDCMAGACFTRNAFQAAPVQWSRHLLHQSVPIQGLIVNSGCANACTGDQGYANAERMSQLATQACPLSNSRDMLPPSPSPPPMTRTTPNMLVLSTGVIGQPLPMDRIEQGIQTASQHWKSTPEAWTECARAFMTTDTFPKLRVRSLTLPGSGHTIRFMGISKGAGMIHPNMATLLSLIVTDARLESQQELQAITRRVCERSFNAISVDGDCSTNDSFIVLANGGAMSQQEVVRSAVDRQAFEETLLDLAQELAQLIVRDGEGATKFVSVTIKGAKSMAQAKQVATSICTSSLVKTAFYGQDANWGRIMAAIGYSGAEFHPDQVDLWIASDHDRLQLVKGGQPFHVQEDRASSIFKEYEIQVEVNLNEKQPANDYTMWTCDLSNEYVDINADYRS